MTTIFKIEYHTAWGESLSIVLGGKKYPMTWTDGAIWTVAVENVKPEWLKNYTYVVMREGIIIRPEWTSHSAAPAREIVDRWIDCPIQGCAFPRKHQVEAFDDPSFRGAGTAIPVFSLRSNNDFGIGEFMDLKLLVDWAVKTGQCIIQLLPVNDTTRKGEWKDSYPYSPVSSFALHPLFINLQKMGVKETKEFKAIQAELNALDSVDYPRVFTEKMRFIKKLYASKGAKELLSPKYLKFSSENAYWLDEYAEFCAKRDNMEADFTRWLQWHLDRQFSEVVSYARSHGVSFKGDLPIGVSSDSADAYFHPQLFNLDSTAGAPPDYFSTDGQNWGFPTYNWEEMARDDYAWWKSRLAKMAEYFDAYRIDHILGFFRIWEIPATQKSGLSGYFNPAIAYSREEIGDLPIEGLFHADPRNPGMFQPLIVPDTSRLAPWQKERFDYIHWDFYYRRNEEFWKKNAQKKLPELLSASGMLACGEDLGMVPACVPGVMSHEKILSLKMRGMLGEGPWDRFSVCATSSHDMETLRMQCANDPSSFDVQCMLREFLDSASMLAIFPLQDWLAIDENIRLADRNAERINQPADPNHKWRYRIHFPLENLCSMSVLNETIGNMLYASGRRRR